MKRWLKRHDNKIIIGLLTGCIGWNAYTIVTIHSALMLMLAVSSIIISLIVIWFVSGAARKCYEWWEKD